MKNMPIVALSSSTTCFILGLVDVVIIDGRQFIKPTPSKFTGKEIKKLQSPLRSTSYMHPGGCQGENAVDLLVQRGMVADISLNSIRRKYLLLADREVVD
jgi:hypothetical protein